MSTDKWDWPILDMPPFIDPLRLEKVPDVDTEFGME
jgi:hypothetical protein